MPIYEYECSNCHHHFDLLQKISDDSIKKCPQCSQDTAKRLVSAAGFQLKGTGWYVTDFKNKDKKQAPEHTTQKTEKTEAAKSSENSSQSKSENKQSSSKAANKET